MVKVRVRQAHKASTANELTILVGDVLEVDVDVMAHENWVGTNIMSGAAGKFPRECVDVVIMQKSSATDYASTPAPAPSPGATLRSRMAAERGRRKSMKHIMSRSAPSRKVKSRRGQLSLPVVLLPFCEVHSARPPGPGTRGSCEKKGRCLGALCSRRPVTTAARG